MNLLVTHKPERLPLSLACQQLDLNRSSLFARRDTAKVATARGVKCLRERDNRAP
ncbi:hypothetical protein KR51_00000930 [Rubidibacter lacunae KORDI 51-2]|uniref:Uncharacterized protein n=1 Tax=Rubidibacter lacunae KORDI 51-2 TaxID=582515 RepID=U5DRG4_9CHRO|nr:hypothetical protein [Rubidibacter lacunae]ERN43199.1 hypothetical protein KR51_00000930 [Rubidibacter lacunae KORDI 51-2]